MTDGNAVGIVIELYVVSIDNEYDGNVTGASMGLFPGRSDYFSNDKTVDISVGEVVHDTHLFQRHRCWCLCSFGRFQV